MSEETATTQGAEAASGFRFAVGTRLADRYTVQRGLGRGGMGEVYQVQDTALGEVVALKMLSARLASDPVALARFQGEVRTARQVGHPNVCRTYDFGVHKDERGETAHFLTMELLSGETLAARLLRERLGRPEVLDLLSQVAGAIDAAHAAGIVHRDLKPANVMLVAHSGGGTRAVVTDFGLARQVDESRVTHEGWVGTPAYVAPEQLAGEAGGPAADLYAFGVMLFEAATGRLPFEGATGPQVALQRMARPAPRARSVDPSLPEEWDEAIARCLEKEPAARFARASDAIRAMGGDAPGAAATVGKRDQRAAWRLRRLIPVLSLIALVVAAATLLGRSRGRPVLPTGERVVSITVGTAPGAASPALPLALPPFNDAAAHVLRQEWTRLEDPRRFRVSREADGNVQARLEWTLRGAVLAGSLELRVGGSVLGRFEAEAPSMRELAIRLYPAVAERLGAGRPSIELFPEEVEEMRVWAAPDAQAYKQLKAAILCTWGDCIADQDEMLGMLAAVLHRYPRWAHAALPNLLGGDFPSSARDHLAQADCSADPEGCAILRSMAEGRFTRAGSPEEFKRWSQRHDLVFDYNLMGLGGDRGTDEESAAWASVMARRYPDLMWAGALTTMANGRPEWHRRSPGNQAAWVKALSALAIGDDPGALAAGDWYRRLRGDAPTDILFLAGAHLGRFELDAAHQLASGLLAASGTLRANALFLLAQESIFRGRLRDAREKHLQALEAAEGAVHFVWIQEWRELMKIDAMMGGTSDRGDRDRLIEYWSRYHWSPGALRAFQWEAEHARAGQCPKLAPPSAVANLTTEQREGVRLTLRASAASGCGGCEPVLREGLSVNEEQLLWTDAYAACAVALGRGLDDALRALRAGEHYRSSIFTFDYSDTSAVDVVRAWYWMGRVLEKQGKATEAKAKYERFLKFWGEADIPIPEVDEARKRLAGLK